MTRKDDKPAAIKPPKHLSREAAEWFAHVVDRYDLDPQHVKLLELTCQAWDRAEGARVALAKHGPTFTDRFHQPRARPEVAIERSAMLTFARLLRELDLEGEPHPGYRRT